MAGKNRRRMRLPPIRKQPRSSFSATLQGQLSADVVDAYGSVTAYEWSRPCSPPSGPLLSYQAAYTACPTQTGRSCGVACYVPASRRVEVTEEQRRLCGGMDDDEVLTPADFSNDACPTADSNPVAFFQLSELDVSLPTPTPTFRSLTDASASRRERRISYTSLPLPLLSFPCDASLFPEMHGAANCVREAPASILGLQT